MVLRVARRQVCLRPDPLCLSRSRARTGLRPDKPGRLPGDAGGQRQPSPRARPPGAPALRPYRRGLPSKVGTPPPGINQTRIFGGDFVECSAKVTTAYHRARFMQSSLRIFWPAATSSCLSSSTLLWGDWHHLVAAPRRHCLAASLRAAAPASRLGRCTCCSGRLLFLAEECIFPPVRGRCWTHTDTCSFVEITF